MPFATVLATYRSAAYCLSSNGCKSAVMEPINLESSRSATACACSDRSQATALAPWCTQSPVAPLLGTYI